MHFHNDWITAMVQMIIVTRHYFVLNSLQYVHSKELLLKGLNMTYFRRFVKGLKTVVMRIWWCWQWRSWKGQRENRCEVQSGHWKMAYGGFVIAFMCLWSLTYDAELQNNITTPRLEDMLVAGRPSNLFHKVTGGRTCLAMLGNIVKLAICVFAQRPRNENPLVSSTPYPRGSVGCG